MKNNQFQKTENHKISTQVISKSITISDAYLGVLRFVFIQFLRLQNRQKIDNNSIENAVEAKSYILPLKLYSVAPSSNDNKVVWDLPLTRIGKKNWKKRKMGKNKWFCVFQKLLISKSWKPLATKKLWNRFAYLSKRRHWDL